MLSRGIRGAITLKENSKEEIESAVVELTDAILSENNIKKEDISFVIYTLTSDLDADFPAKYARIHCGFDLIPMMCYEEIDVPGSMRLCMRALVVVNTDKNQNEIKHQYLKGAKNLRPDINIKD